MKTINALFVGMYPNVVSPYRNVFFQNLIFAMADMGVDCTVVSPVPLTKYGLSIKNIDYKNNRAKGYCEYRHIIFSFTILNKVIFYNAPTLN
jgi:hypothetical protein